VAAIALLRRSSRGTVVAPGRHMPSEVAARPRSKQKRIREALSSCVSSPATCRSWEPTPRSARCSPLCPARAP